MKTVIAIVMYWIGFKPKISTFIDEETVTYGYGQLYSMGDWEYEIPHRFLKKDAKRKWT